MASANLPAHAGISGYETTLIFNASQSDEQIRSFVEKIKGIITQHSGAVLVSEDWGKKRFAYPIEKETRGHYWFFVYSGDNKLVAEIERNLRINESIMRFLTIRLGRDFDAAKYTRKPVGGQAEASVAPVVAHN